MTVLRRARAGTGRAATRAVGRARVQTLALALALVASGCGRSPTAPVPDAYVLTTVAGASLPALLDERVVAGENGDELHRIEATAGTLELTEGRYALDLRLHATIDGRAAPLRRILDRGAVAEAGGRADVRLRGDRAPDPRGAS